MSMLSPTPQPTKFCCEHTLPARAFLIYTGYPVESNPVNTFEFPARRACPAYMNEKGHVTYLVRHWPKSGHRSRPEC
jgi:hypothetical protein